MPVPTQKAPSGSRVTAVAEAVLRGNDSGRYTLPSRTLYPHQWNWDSALAALGWAELDAGRAWTELESLAGALASRYGVCSLDRAHPQHSARNYWRGPLVERMLLAVDGGGMREYYSPESGRGLGARDFTWTAALCLRARAWT